MNKMNRINGINRPFKFLPLSRALLLLAAVLAGSASLEAAAADARGISGSSPTVISEIPDNGATHVPTSTNSSNNLVTGTAVSASFSEPMDPVSFNSSPAALLLTFTLKESTGNLVPGSVSMNAANTVATFTPSWSALTRNTNYTATITTAAKSAGGVAMLHSFVWSFTTTAVAFTAQAPVKLGTAGNFAILSKTGITNVPNSRVNGDMGVSPIAHTAITGFSEAANSSNTYATSAQVVGKIYAADYAAPTPTYMTTAIGDMEIAYNDAAGRSLPNSTELGAGEIGGLTLAPGLYKWSSHLLVSNNLTLSGGPNDVWIFQIAGNLNQANATRISLAGGAQAKNIFWQAAGAVTIGTTAHFEGIILSKTLIAVKTGATANGRLMAQTAVTLEQNVVTQPTQ